MPKLVTSSHKLNRNLILTQKLLHKRTFAALNDYYCDCDETITKETSMDKFVPATHAAQHSQSSRHRINLQFVFTVQLRAEAANYLQTGWSCVPSSICDKCYDFETACCRTRHATLKWNEVVVWHGGGSIDSSTQLSHIRSDRQCWLLWCEAQLWMHKLIIWRLYETNDSIQ